MRRPTSLFVEPCAAHAPRRARSVLRVLLVLAVLAGARSTLADAPGPSVVVPPPPEGSILDVVPAFGGAPGWEADVAASLGRELEHRGDLDGALEALGKALSLHERSGDVRASASALRAIGLVRERAGATDEARAAQRRALALSDSVADAAGSAAALGNLGGLHWRASEYAASLGCQERALGILEALGDRRRVAATLCNLGVVYQRIGDGDRALSCYERAIQRLDGPEDRARLAIVLANSGALYAGRGELDRALGQLSKASAASGEAGDRASLALALTNEGYVQAALWNFDEAASAHERALAICEALGDREGAVESRTALGLVASSRGDPERALSLLRGAVDEAETIGAADALVVGLWASAAVRLELGETVEAMAAARRAIEEMPVLVGGLCDEHGALARQRLAPVFETGLRAAVALDDAEQAAYFLESGRAGALLEALGGRERLHEIVVPSELRDAERRARAEEARALVRYRDALDAGGLASARAGRAAYETARGGVRQVIERIQREAKAAAQLVYPRAASLAELRAGLAKHEALVTYAVLSDRTLALVVTRAGARIVPLGTRQALEAACRGLEVLASPGADTTGVVEALRRLIVEPLELPPSFKRVLVSPDGLLAYVPFALLFDRRQVVNIPSGTTWQLLEADGEKRGLGVLALGDPAYETDGPGANRLARAHSGVGFAALPYTRLEAQAVGDVVLLGGEATEAGFRYAVGRRPRWRAVHLACHGVVDVEAPLLSALALTPSAEDDGFLTAMDVLGSEIPADLVVLSACRTGRGRVVRGEGVIGFVRAFMFAGSPRVVVSLWNGDDQATRVLMSRFHEGLKQGQPTAAALSAAQAAVRARPEWQHPYYWAGWVLWGLAD